MDKLEELRAFVSGSNAAMTAAVGALIRTHPQPQALAEMLALYYQREQAYLENSNMPEHAIDSFQACWKRIELEIQHTLKEPQQPGL